MLDAFRNISGSKGKLVQKQTDELQVLIATARDKGLPAAAPPQGIWYRPAPETCPRKDPHGEPCSEDPFRR